MGSRCLARFGWANTPRAGRIQPILLAAVVGVLAGREAHATSVIDLWSAFPATQGHNGFSAKAYFPSPASDLLLDDAGAYRFVYNASGSIYRIPYLVRDTSTWILTHPYNSAHAVLESAIPAGGTQSYACAVNGEFAMRNSGTVQTDLQINRDRYKWSGIISGTSGSVLFNESFILSPGDRLRFGIAPYPNDTSDGSKLRGTNPERSPGARHSLTSGSGNRRFVP